ncbi:hypothetical protein Ndes2526B_g02183 [Nannochloris sp. 'desiccata']|nr:hypothetical protein NADE_007766 [Chlorella desiccata (nom. nud.)]
MVQECFTNPDSKEKPTSEAPTLNRINALHFDKMADWAMGNFLITHDEIPEKERLLEENLEHLLVEKFNFSSKIEIPGVTWLILSKSRAQLARWLSKNRKYPNAKGLFKCLVFDINNASPKFSDGCWEEKFMRVFSLNLMAIFRTIVPPEEMNRKLIDDGTPVHVENCNDSDSPDSKPFESEDSEMDAAPLGEMGGGDSGGK